MYLVDTNIFLEALLEQEKVEDVRSFFQAINLEDLYITDLALHSIGIILFKFKKNNLFFSFLNDMVKNGMNLIVLSTEELMDLNKVVDRFNLDFDRFSVSLPDEAGRLVMFNYNAEEYTPSFVFNQYKNHVALGINDRYEIYILGNDGKIQGKITSDKKGGTISPEESKYLANLINESTKLPEQLKKVFIKRIPRFKNAFSHVLLSERFIWVFHIKNDITKEDSDVLTDLYSYTFELMGTLLLKEIPIFISDEYMYTVNENEEDGLLLVKYKYAVESKR